jgi:RNA polymerase sigma-70 factor (ECF subfamily)
MTLTTETIWNNFNKELLQFIKKRVNDTDAANDLLQDIFVKIHLKHATLTDSDKLSAWVYQITRNSIIDYYKKHKPAAGILHDGYEAEEPEAVTEEFGKCLKPFINQLPETYRDALLQTELGKLSQKEFAEKADISYSGAKSRIQRGRQQLLQLFNKCCKVSADKYGNILEYQSKQNCSC